MQSFVLKLALSLFIACSALSFRAAAAPQPKVVSFQVGKQKLKGYLWVPAGDGPFPALVWSYGHHLRLMKQGGPEQYTKLADFYLGLNYVLFIPDRGPHPEDGAKNGSFGRVAEAKTEHLIAAISWLRQQSYVNASKVAVSGTLNGTVHAVLAAERDSTIRALIISNPGSFTWESNPELRTLMLSAVRNVNVPIFMMQPQNDKSLGPAKTLGGLLTAKGGLSRTKVYLPYPGELRNFGKDAVNVWGSDLKSFLEAAMN